MSKVIFYLLKENADGNVVIDRSVAASNLDVYKNGVLFSSVISNRDGTFYFDITESDVYTVKLNGTTQDEFRDIYCPTTDQLLTTDVDGVTIQMNGQGQLEVINGDTILRQENIADNLTTSSSIRPLSANMAYSISQSIAEKETKDSTILREVDIINDFTSGGTDKVQSADSLKLDLTGTNYLFDATSYNSAMRELDNRIAFVTAGGTYRSYTPYGYGTALNNTSASVELKTIGSAVNNRGYKMVRAGTITGLSVVYDITEYTRAGSGDEYSQVFDIYKNGVVINTCQISNESPTVQKYSIIETAPTSKFSAGDTLTVSHSMIDGVGDTTTIENISCLIEISN